MDLKLKNALLFFYLNKQLLKISKNVLYFPIKYLVYFNFLLNLGKKSISPLFWKDIFTGNSLLDWWYFSFRKLNMFHSLQDYILSIRNVLLIPNFILPYVMCRFFLLAAFKIFLCNWFYTMLLQGTLVWFSLFLCVQVSSGFSVFIGVLFFKSSLERPHPIFLKIFSPYLLLLQGLQLHIWSLRFHLCFCFLGFFILSFFSVCIYHFEWSLLLHL